MPLTWTELGVLAFWWYLLQFGWINGHWLLMQNNTLTGIQAGFCWCCRFTFLSLWIYQHSSKREKESIWDCGQTGHDKEHPCFHAYSLVWVIFSRQTDILRECVSIWNGKLNLPQETLRGKLAPKTVSKGSSLLLLFDLHSGKVSEKNSCFFPHRPMQHIYIHIVVGFISYIFQRLSLFVLISSAL